MSSTLTPRAIRVLLVEDNADDALLLERHLRRNGFDPILVRVETAAGMEQALNAETPDIILADYNLPEYSGPAALAQLKATGLDIPFIMMSGAVSEQTAVDSMRAGAHDYIAKQNLARLVPAIDRELEEAATRRNKHAAEAALLASESRFHHLVEAMPLGLLITTEQGRIVYANQSAERLLGRSREDIASSNVTTETFCPDLARVYDAPEGPPATPFEAVCHDAAGNDIDVLIGVAALNPDAANPDKQYAAFIADLTLQKRSEEVLRRTEKLAVAGRFAASIAHEINNPLESVVNCLYLAGLADLPPEAREYLDLAQSELDRVAQITVQTLRFYRGSTRPSLTDIHELMENVVALLQTRMRNMQIQVVRRLQASPNIVAQDGEIRQVIVNLITNAIDALGEEGTLVLRTAASYGWRNPRTGEGPRRGIAITIADNGAGMAADVKKRIFEPFFSTKGITGTGLGLWISEQIVEKHEGSIHVRSRPTTPTQKGGTVFRLFIPDTASSS